MSERESVIHDVPTSQFMFVEPPKPLHPSKRKRKRWEVERLPRGARKRIKGGTNVRENETRGFVTGDRIFSHDEIVGDGRKLTTANDERAVWMRAGTDRADGATSAARTRAGLRRLAAERCALSKGKRIKAAVEVVLAKRGRVIPSWVGYEMARDDVRAGRCVARSGEMVAAQRRYSAWVRDWLVKHPVEPRARQVSGPTPEAHAAAVKRQPIERLFTRCEHDWKVEPKRLKRTCDRCGTVEHKERGRWQPAAPKFVRC